MRWWLVTLMMLLSVLVGCSSEVSAETLAASTFAEFQDALFRHDRAKLRPLLCLDSRPVVQTLLDTDLDNLERLVVTDVIRHGYEYRVHVEDPNRGDHSSFYVLTIEDGQMRVDLIATTRYQSIVVHRKLSRPTFVPQPLTRAQVEEAEEARRR